MKFFHVTAALCLIVVQAVAFNAPVDDTVVDGLLDVLGITPDMNADNITFNLYAGFGRFNAIVANFDTDQLVQPLLQIKSVLEPISQQLDGLTRDRFLQGAQSLVLVYKKWMAGVLVSLGFDVYDSRYDALRAEYNGIFNASYQALLDQTKDLNDDELKKYVEDEIEEILAYVDNVISSIGSFDFTLVATFFNDLQNSLAATLTNMPNFTYDQFREEFKYHLGILSNLPLYLAFANSG
ncbi:hypothetical protein ElyMa_002583000 [Elysia marginata]|uniref:Uncharacterized protein n=1 Tax=Elysia marginata TaxID=1093978 RepID=A0AAV4H3D2_9GAST|nr:hypothetical protein ElyMa_002583000 [Elysia marginata]